MINNVQEKQILKTQLHPSCLHELDDEIIQMYNRLKLNVENQK